MLAWSDPIESQLKVCCCKEKPSIFCHKCRHALNNRRELVTRIIMKFLSYKEILIETQISKEEFQKRFSTKVVEPLKWYLSIWSLKKAPYEGSMHGDTFTIKIQDYSVSEKPREMLAGSKGSGTVIENGDKCRIKMNIYRPKIYRGRSFGISLFLVFTTLFMATLASEPLFTGIRDTEGLGRTLLIFFLYTPLVWLGLRVAEKTWNLTLEKIINDYLESIKYIAGEIKVLSQQTED